MYLRLAMWQSATPGRARLRESRMRDGGIMPREYGECGMGCGTSPQHARTGGTAVRSCRPVVWKGCHDRQGMILYDRGAPEPADTGGSCRACSVWRRVGGSPRSICVPQFLFPRVAL